MCKTAKTERVNIVNRERVAVPPNEHYWCHVIFKPIVPPSSLKDDFHLKKVEKIKKIGWDHGDYVICDMNFDKGHRRFDVVQQSRGQKTALVLS